MVDPPSSKVGAARREGSNPSPATKDWKMNDILNVAMAKFFGHNLPANALDDKELVTLQRHLQKKVDVLTVERQRRKEELESGCPI